MKERVIYKHWNCTDMCIAVLKAQMGEWFTVVYCDLKCRLYTDRQELVFISEENQKNWSKHAEF